MTRAFQRGFLAGVVAMLVPAGSMGADASQVFATLIKSRLVHCAFYKSYTVDPVNGDLVLVEGRSNSLTHFQGMDRDRARQISTRMAGAREVRMTQNTKYLHFVDQVAGMYLLTTIYGCIDRDKSGVCVTYGAVQSRNFDSRVLSDPDAVYEALKDSSDPGFCDHSFIHIQEASTKTRD